jgi:polar amino acid transport system substrate-binding protein
MLQTIKCACLALLIISGFAKAALAQDAQCEPEKVSSKYPDYADRVVKIAVTPTYPPYSYLDPQDPDHLIGLEVDMIKDVMKCDGLKYQFVEGAWAALLQAMFSGSADVMIGRVNYTEARAEKVNFVLYGLSGESVVVQKGNPRKIVDLESLCGTTGSATVGGSSALLVAQESKSCVAQGKPAIHFEPASDSSAAYRQVMDGRTDWASDDVGAAATRIADDPALALGFTIKSDLETGFVVPKGSE